MITSALGPSETSLPSIPAKQKKLFFIGQPLGILIFRLLCQTLNEYLRLHYWESTSHLSLHLCICKQDAYANKSASLLIITDEVARFEHSGTTHIIYRSYHVCYQVNLSLTNDDRHRMGAISRKAIRRGVSHTDFDIDEIINSADRKLFSQITQPRHCLHHLLPHKTALTVFGKDSIIISYLMLNVNSIKTVSSLVVCLTFDDF